MELELLINKYYEKLTYNDKYICQCIIEHKKDCIRMPISDFSRKYHISASALSRFAKKIGLPGYSELKAMLKFEQKGLCIQTTADELMACYDSIVDMLEKADCSEVFRHINSSGRIIVYGEGYNQGRIAKEMKRIFLPAGRPFYDVYGRDMAVSLQEFVRPEDMIFFISMKGETEEITALARKLKLKGVYMVSITKMLGNTLAELCDENFYIQSLSFWLNKELEYNVSAPYFIMAELLYVKYKLYCNKMNIFSNSENKC